LDEEATFTPNFSNTWQKFMLQCFSRMIQEILDEKQKLIEITDLNRLTASYDLYDAGNLLDLNNKAFKDLIIKELE
jgi:hypothetical protein